MRTGRILVGGALIAAVASVAIGFGAGAAQASPTTECARWVEQSIYYNDLGQNYTQVGNAWSAAGYPAAAQEAYNNAAQAFSWSSMYDSQWRRNCQLP